jgi:hypothetical protein
MSFSFSFCQRCEKAFDYWLVNQAEFNIGAVVHWKVQLCRECTTEAEKAVRTVLRPTSVQFSQLGGER